MRERVEFKALAVRVLVPLEPSPECSAIIAADLDPQSSAGAGSPASVGTGERLELYRETVGDWSGRSALAIPPQVCVLYIDGDEPATLPGAVGQALQECRIVWLRGPGRWSPDGGRGADGEFAAVVDARALPSDAFRVALSALASGAISDLLRERSRIALALALAELLSSVVTQEQRGAKVRKGQLQQRLTRLQQRGAVRDVEPLTQVRSIVRRHLGDFEKGLQVRTDELVAPHIGSLAQHVRGVVAGLESLEESPQSRTMALAVPPAFTEALLSDLRQRLHEAGHRDIAALRDEVLLMEEEVNGAVESHGLPPLPLDVPPLPQDRLQRLLTQAIRIERAYAGQAPRQGVMEYFMGARRYQMLFFMLVSVVGPIFGLQRGFQATNGFLVVSALLLVGGGISVTRSVKRERVEKLEGELGKAREALAQELTRALVGFGQGWTTAVGEWLRTLEQRVLAVAESTLREQSQRRAQEVTDERHRLQLQVQGLDANERRLTAALKTRESTLLALRQAEGTVDAQLTTALREVFASCGLAST